VAKPLGIDVVEAAWGIERIVHANMANETRRILSSHGADPRGLSLIAYGGNGGVHGWAIARELGAQGYLVPKTAPAFSALGVLVADYKIDLEKAYTAPLARVDLARLRELMQLSFDEAAHDLVESTGLPEELVALELFVQMAYPGQNFALSVSCPEGTSLDAAGLERLASRFHDLHETTRGFGFRDQAPIVRGVRLVGSGITPKPERTAALGDEADVRKALKGERPACFGEDFLDTPIYDGPRLAPGAEIRGPALIEEPFTVVVLAPGYTARLDEHGNYGVTFE
jgi:N-methylhydantoinase A